MQKNYGFFPEDDECIVYTDMYTSLVYCRYGLLISSLYYYWFRVLQSCVSVLLQCLLLRCAVVPPNRNLVLGLVDVIPA